MIFGIGTDIIEISRIEATVARHGERFINRILTPEERQVFEQRNQPIVFLATRFAAKEALAKAFGTGIGTDISFQGIEITNDSMGKPEVTLTATAEQYAAKQGIKHVFLSISDEKHYAVAMAVLET